MPMDELEADILTMVDYHNNINLWKVRFSEDDLTESKRQRASGCEFTFTQTTLQSITIE